MRAPLGCSRRLWPLLPTLLPSVLHRVFQPRYIGYMGRRRRASGRRARPQNATKLSTEDGAQSGEHHKQKPVDGQTSKAEAASEDSHRVSPDGFPLARATHAYIYAMHLSLQHGPPSRPVNALGVSEFPLPITSAIYTLPLGTSMVGILAFRHCR